MKRVLSRTEKGSETREEVNKMKRRNMKKKKDFLHLFALRLSWAITERSNA